MEVRYALEDLFEGLVRLCPECKNGPDRVRHYESCTIYCDRCNGHGIVSVNGSSLDGGYGE